MPLRGQNIALSTHLVEAEQKKTSQYLPIPPRRQVEVGKQKYDVSRVDVRKPTQSGQYLGKGKT